MSEPLPLFPVPSRAQSTGWLTCPSCKLEWLVLTVGMTPETACPKCGLPTSERAS